MKPADLARRVRALASGYVRKASKIGADEAHAKIKLYAQTRMNVRTGNLLRNSGAVPTVRGFLVYSNVHYASYLNDGTYRIRARRHVTDATSAGATAARRYLRTLAGGGR